MKSDIKIHKANKTNVEILAYINYHSWQEAYKDIVNKEKLSRMSIEKLEERWNKILDENKREIFILEFSGKQVAYCSFEKDINVKEKMLFLDFDNKNNYQRPNKYAEIGAIYLLPDYWNSGLGSTFLNYILNELKDYKIFLYVFYNNYKAIKFYQKFNFQLKNLSEENYPESNSLLALMLKED